MMTNNMKAYELNEMAMNHVTGGNLPPVLKHPTQELVAMYEEQNMAQKQDEAFFNAASTAWEVVKHALGEIF